MYYKIYDKKNKEFYSDQQFRTRFDAENFLNKNTSLSEEEKKTNFDFALYASQAGEYIQSFHYEEA